MKPPDAKAPEAPAQTQTPLEKMRALMEESVAKQRASVSGAMDSSLEKQRESVRKQAATANLSTEAGATASGFFTVPWPKPVVMLSPTAMLGAAGDCDPLPAAEVNALISETSQKQGLSSDLLREVMRQESGFKPCAISTAGAQGLMQLMPSTQDYFGVRDPFNPRENIEAGGKFLKQLLERYGGDLMKALSAYNAGPTRVDQADGLPAIPQTQNYVYGILSRLPLIQ